MAELKYDKKTGRLLFTKQMKKEYTILMPNMAPIHFKILEKVFNYYGYKSDLLDTTGPEIAQTGLKYVHNDTCYPALLVIGQFINALQSGKYDVHKVALMITQTGGGCRASNYIFLLRKALKKAGFEFVPPLHSACLLHVLSRNFAFIRYGAQQRFFAHTSAYPQICRRSCVRRPVNAAFKPDKAL